VIRLLLVLIAVAPVTIYYAFRIAWGVGRGGEAAKCACDYVPRAWSRVMLRVAGVRIEVENAEMIDLDVPQVVVANHSSWWDVPVMAASVPGPYVFVAKKEIERAPFFGPAVRSCGYIFVDRKDRGKALESLGVARLRLEEDGSSIVMFPEGTRSDSGELQRFKKGAFMLAIQTGADVVPTAIVGARDVMRKGSFWIRPGVIRVRFGEPISVDGYTVDRRDELTAKAWDSVSALQASDALN
jgi:1-acyl-sn-glycerol-3-phosphate acyltransferase